MVPVDGPCLRTECFAGLDVLHIDEDFVVDGFDGGVFDVFFEGFEEHGVGYGRWTGGGCGGGYD